VSQGAPESPNLKEGCTPPCMLVSTQTPSHQMYCRQHLKRLLMQGTREAALRSRPGQAHLSHKSTNNEAALCHLYNITKQTKAGHIRSRTSQPKPHRHTQCAHNTAGVEAGQSSLQATTVARVGSAVTSAHPPARPIQCRCCTDTDQAGGAGGKRCLQANTAANASSYTAPCNKVLGTPDTRSPAPPCLRCFCTRHSCTGDVAQDYTSPKPGRRHVRACSLTQGHTPVLPAVLYAAKQVQQPHAHLCGMHAL
jgi:hypothetical protein